MKYNLVSIDQTYKEVPNSKEDLWQNIYEYKQSDRPKFSLMED